MYYGSYVSIVWRLTFDEKYKEAMGCGALGVFSYISLNGTQDQIRLVRFIETNQMI